MPLKYYTKSHSLPIPADLTSRPHWVGWKWIKRDGRPTKKPQSPEAYQHAADATDPEHLLTFDEAVAYAHRRELAGVGYVIMADDPFTGIDFDGCRDPETGEIDPRAWARIRLLIAAGAYVEVSPSGTGVKALAHASKPGTRSKLVDAGEYGCSQIEIYDAARFFTVTGQALDGVAADEIGDGQFIVEALYHDLFGNDPEPSTSLADTPGNDLGDAEVIERARSAKNGERFARLFDRGDASGYGSQSEADLALAGTLMFWTGGDREQTARLMRRSALYREKMDREDYMRRTLDKACEGRGPEDVYMGDGVMPEFPNSLVGTRELLSGITPASILGVDLEQRFEAQTFGNIGRPGPIEWIIKYLMPGGFPSTLYGMGGEGKSWSALLVAISVAAGHNSWLGHEICKPTRVLYLDFELDAATQSWRAFDLAAGLGLDVPPDDLFYLSALGHSTAEAFRKAYEVCRDHGIGLVVIDSIGPALEGDAEASTDVLAFMRKYIEPLSAAGIATLLVDHEAKTIKGERRTDKKPFGSVYKLNSNRSVIQVQGDWHGSTLTVLFRHVKTNFGPKLEDFAARFTFSAERVEVERADTLEVNIAAEPTVSDKIVNALVRHGPMYADKIAEYTGCGKKSIQNVIPDLVKAEKIEYTGETYRRARQVRVAGVYDPDSMLDDGLGDTEAA